MRKPARGSSKAPRGASVSRTLSIPAPVGGWNARDSLANMPPEDAILMENWFPETNDVRIRKGYSQHVTGITSAVESLMCYSKPDGTKKLFAAEDTDFFDVTTAGTVGAAVQSSLSNARWYHVNFTNSGGTSYLCAFNGTDKPRYYDGSSWTSIDSGSTPAITGVTSTNLIFPFIHKRRIFLVEKDSLKLWYLPVDSVGGAANAFDLAGIADKGGYIVAGGAWTIDGGSGVDDHLVAVTSEGQVIVYSGTNPASDYTLIGVWNIGEPIGRRCLIKYRGDLLIITREGVYPLSVALQSSQVDPEAALTFKINKAMTDAANNYSGNFGWQLAFYPGANMLILNVPVFEGRGQQQYVMNTITGSWSKFKAVEASCWEICDGDIYFGGDGFVGKFWDTDADNDTNINGDVLHAYNYMGSRGAIKQIKSLRPNLLSTGAPTVLVGVNEDFVENVLSGALSFSANPAGVWDQSLWDQAAWSGSLAYVGQWLTVAGVGTALAPRLKTATKSIELRYAAMDVLLETGTVIG